MIIHAFTPVAEAWIAEFHESYGSDAHQDKAEFLRDLARAETLGAIPRPAGYAEHQSVVVTSTGTRQQFPFVIVTKEARVYFRILLEAVASAPSAAVPSRAIAAAVLGCLADNQAHSRNYLCLNAA